MTTMQAARLEAVKSIPTWTSLPVPAPGPNDVRIKVKAAALNRRDFWITQGQYPGVEPPHTLGSDGVGTVDSIGTEAVTSVSVGDRVIVNPGLFWGNNDAFQDAHFEILGVPRDGTLAEHIVVPSENVAACPKHLTDSEAAALPLAGVTAYRALVTRANLQPGERVLITGLGGGVSSLGALFARALGAEVWGTSGQDHKLEFFRETYDIHGFNYHSDTWTKDAKTNAGGFDVILDGTGGAGFKGLLKLLNPGGRIAFYGGTQGTWPEILPQHLFYRQLSIVASTMGSPRDFEGMLNLVTTHTIRPIVWKTFEASDLGQAFDALATHSQLGKVVINIPN